MRVTFSGRAKRGGIKTPYCLLVLSFSKTVLSSCFGVSTAYTVKAYGFSTPENNFIFVVTRRRSFREVVKLFEKFSLKRATFSVDSYSCAQEHFKLKSSWKEKSAVFRFWGYSNTRFGGANTHFYGRSAFSDAFFKNLAQNKSGPFSTQKVSECRIISVESEQLEKYKMPPFHGALQLQHFLLDGVAKFTSLNLE